MSDSFFGIPASGGICLGKVIIKKDEDREINFSTCSDVDEEIKRFNKSLEETKKQIEETYQNALNTIPEKEAKIFQAHLLILEDSLLVDKVKNRIKTDKIKSEYALKLVLDDLIKSFQNLEDEYLRERTLDIKDVGDRILLNLSCKKGFIIESNEDVILICSEITPSEILKINKEKIKGICCEFGGKNSHSSIIARSLGIPLIVGMKDITKIVKEKDLIFMNADTGEIKINMNKKEIEKCREIIESDKRRKKYLETLINLSPKTLDGCKVKLFANIKSKMDLDFALLRGAQGVGLFRTEFLFMEKKNPPSEDEQFKVYREVAEKSKGKPIIIRTLDVGGDKKIPYFEDLKEQNPFLGLRGIRLSFKNKEIFTTQIRAILRASIYGNLRMMFPFISLIEEVRMIKDILEEVKKNLKKEKISFNENILIGIMIEIPSAALLADILIKEVDFFSIGTNDLIQYNLAVDRENEKVSYLYQNLHPANLLLIKNIIDAGIKNNKEVGICGEMASDKFSIPILLGLGLREFSVNPHFLLEFKDLIRKLKIKDLENLSKEALLFLSSFEVKKMVEDYFKKLED